MKLISCWAVILFLISISSVKAGCCKYCAAERTGNTYCCVSGSDCSGKMPPRNPSEPRKPPSGRDTGHRCLSCHVEIGEDFSINKKITTNGENIHLLKEKGMSDHGVLSETELEIMNIASEFVSKALTYSQSIKRKDNTNIYEVGVIIAGKKCLVVIDKKTENVQVKEMKCAGLDVDATK